MGVGLDLACVLKGNIVNSDDGKAESGSERDSPETGPGDSSSADSLLAALSAKRRYRYVDLFDEHEWDQALAHMVLGGSFLDVVEKANRRLAGFDPEEQALYREEIEREMYFRRAFDSIAERAGAARTHRHDMRGRVGIWHFRIAVRGEQRRDHLVAGRNDEATYGRWTGRGRAGR